MKCLNYEILIVSLYVDDLLVTGSNIVMIDEFKQDMMKVFEMIDCGEMKFFLGIEIKQNNKGIFICQKKYCNTLLFLGNN